MSDFRQEYGNADFSAAYNYTAAPVTYPVTQPAPARSYGAIRPGASDVIGGSEEERRRAQQFADRLQLVTEGIVTAAGAYGAVRAKSDPARRIPNTGFPVLGSTYGSGTMAGFSPGMTLGQLLFIGVLGTLLLVGIAKG